MATSIVILNYFNPHVINVCLRTLQITEGIDYEVIVVDNGSDAETIKHLEQHKEEGRIDKLVLNGENKFFSEGNNIGVTHAEAGNEILLLNSDVGFKRPDWLQKLYKWLDGEMKPPELRPNMWATHPTVVKPGPLDIVSCGWSYDEAVQPSLARPEGWCCLFRRDAWRDMSHDFPYYYGFEEAVALTLRSGKRCGVLWNYSSFLIHREQGSGGPLAHTYIHSYRTPDMYNWYLDLEIETLDFSHPGDRILEHSTYMEWD